MAAYLFWKGVGGEDVYRKYYRNDDISPIGRVLKENPQCMPWGKVAQGAGMGLLDFALFGGYGWYQSLTTGDWTYAQDASLNALLFAMGADMAGIKGPRFKGWTEGTLAPKSAVQASLEFTGAPLVQGELKASALLKGDLSTPIYRLAGGDAPLMGRSWTTLDPRSFSSIAEFKQAAGIASWNTGDTLVIGRLRSFEGAVGRTALPVEGIPRPWVPEIRLNSSADKMIDVIETVPVPK